MNYTLTYNRLTHASHSSKHLHGSSSLVLNRDFLAEGCQTLSSPISFNNLSIFDNIFSEFIEPYDSKNFLLRQCLQHSIKPTRAKPLPKDPDQKKKMLYRLNKKKVTDKALALCMTKSAKKHLSFNSISFPSHMTEVQIYEVFNYWLTDMRRYFGLKHYLWVAEYQGNGTTHYHMITTNKMDKRKINDHMALILSRKGYLDGRETLYFNKKVGQFVKGKLTFENYNGLHQDVVKDNDKKKVVGYLVKYISKQEDLLHERLPWHCSRSVSCLFTKVTISDLSFYEIEKQLPENTYIFANEYATVYFFNQKIGTRIVDGKPRNDYFFLHDKYFRYLQKVNDFIIDKFDNDEL